MNFNQYKKKAKLIRKNERYNLYDLQMEKMVLSLTEMNPKQETTGHSHKNAEEVYFFRLGNGIIQLNKKKEKVKGGDVITIKKNVFHKVFNPSRKNKLVFFSVFQKYSGRGKK